MLDGESHAWVALYAGSVFQTERPAMSWAHDARMAIAQLWRGREKRSFVRTSTSDLHRRGITLRHLLHYLPIGYVVLLAVLRVLNQCFARSRIVSKAEKLM